MASPAATPLAISQAARARGPARLARAEALPDARERAALLGQDHQDRASKLERQVTRGADRLQRGVERDLLELDRDHPGLHEHALRDDVVEPMALLQPLEDVLDRLGLLDHVDLDLAQLVRSSDRGDRDAQREPDQRSKDERSNEHDASVRLGRLRRSRPGPR